MRKHSRFAIRHIFARWCVHRANNLLVGLLQRRGGQLLAIGILAAAITARAQETNRFEFFGGYSIVHASISTDVPSASPSHVDTNGFNLSAAAYFNRWFGAVADYSAHFGSKSVHFIDPFSGQSVTGDVKAHVFPLQFGPQVRFPGHRVTPFARVMFGFFRIRTIAPDFRDLDNDFGLSLGGGVDVRASEHVGIRVGQADYIRSHLTPKSWQNNWRFSAGLVFGF
jgi:hypothetical protein